MHRTSAHHLLQEDILSLNCEDLTFLIYEQIQSCKLNRTLMLLLMWNLSSIYPIFKIFSSVFMKLNYLKTLNCFHLLLGTDPEIFMFYIATTPHATKQFTHYTEQFTRNVSCMEVTHLFGVVAIFRVSNKHIFFLFLSTIQQCTAINW